MGINVTEGAYSKVFVEVIYNFPKKLTKKMEDLMNELKKEGF